MKKITTISLFIFFAVVVAILVAGLIFYQNKKILSTDNSPINNTGKVNAASVQQITLNSAEISKHNSRTDCWMIINNKVYNVTSYLSAHPGGADTMTPYCGQEATQAYDTKDIGRPHSNNASAMLNDYYIGDLNQTIGGQQIQQTIQQTNSVQPSGRNREYEDD
ncbi:MAG: cytochrome b5 domain-containing protein [bacterium]